MEVYLDWLGDDLPEGLLWTEECPLYELLTKRADEEAGGWLERHELAGWREAGAGRFLLAGDFRAEACSADHVKEEDRMDAEFPLKDGYPNVPYPDRARLSSLQLIRFKELESLALLLHTGATDFLKMQALGGLKDKWEQKKHADFGPVPLLMTALADTVFASSDPRVRRLAAQLMAQFVKDPGLKEQLMTVQGEAVVNSFLSALIDPDLLPVNNIRPIIAECLANATQNDLDFTAVVIKLSSFRGWFEALESSEDAIFKIHFLQLMKHILMHPFGFESLTLAEDYDSGLLFRALASLVPQIHKLGFEILNVILRISRSPHQQRIHERVFQENGTLALVSLIDEAYLLDPSVALHAMILIDHIADGQKGARNLLYIAFNILKSLVFYEVQQSRMNRSFKNSIKYRRSEKYLPESINNLIKESQGIDKYNAINAPIQANFTMPLDYDFLGDTRQRSPSQRKAIESVKRVKGEMREKRKTLSKYMYPITPDVMLCSQRIDWRLDHGWLPIEGRPDIIMYARKGLKHTDVGKAFENSLKIMAMEILSKLSTITPGKKLLVELIRNLCPLLKRYKDNPEVCESVGYCLKHLISNNSEHLQSFLPNYYLVRELLTALNSLSNEQVQYSILGAIASLLKECCTSVYSFTNFKIRPKLLEILKMTPELHGYTCLNNLIIIYCLAKVYKRRDFIMSRTVVHNLFRIIQDTNIEEISKIYATVSLSFLTLANKRYRKLIPADKDKMSSKIKKSSGSHISSNSNLKSVSGTEFSPSGPYPTINSFLSPPVNEQLFLQLGYRKKSPCRFFISLLMNVLLQRAPKIWNKYVTQHHCELMKWLKESYIEKQPMAGMLYKTIMLSNPTLSFYYNDIVHPWSKIDAEDFYVCVGEDKKHTFEEIVSIEVHDRNPIYCVYKLSKNERVTSTPWDIFWKERASAEKSKIHSDPSFTPSVFPNSLFGLGGYCRAKGREYELGVVYTQKMKSYLPVYKDKAYFFHTKTADKVEHEKPTSTFQRAILPTPYLNVLINKYNTEHVILKDVIMPTLYRHKKQLFGGFHQCSVLNYEVSHSTLLTDTLNLSDSQVELFKEFCYRKVIEYYRPHLKMFTKYQFKLFVKALEKPPSLWLRAIQHEVDNDEKVKEIRTLFEYFPNSFLKNLPEPTYEEYEHAINMPKYKMRAYERAVNMVSTLILNAYEQSNHVFFTLPKETQRCDAKQNHIAWLDGKRMPSLASQDVKIWYPQLTFYGEVFMNALERPQGDKLAHYLLQYNVPFVLEKSSSRLFLPRASNPSLSSLKTAKKTIVPSRDGRPSRDPGQIWVSLPSKSRTTLISSCSIGSDEQYPLYLPTRTEVIIDLFFQPGKSSFKGFHYLLEKDTSEDFRSYATESFLQKASVFQGGNNLKSFTILSTHLPSILLERTSYILKKTIDYQYNEPIVSSEFNETFDRRPNQTPNFTEYCEYIKKRIYSILHKGDYQCWYSDLLKFIAKSVCTRLEGPYNYVDEHLMDRHRNELKVLLGTSVIPFGRLRIGGRLERSILFKFIADQYMIPCGLHRGSANNTWVEVPRHPFLYPERGTCIVNLDDSPGELIEEGSPKADKYKGYAKEEGVKECFINFDDAGTESGLLVQKTIGTRASKKSEPTVSKSSTSDGDIVQETEEGKEISQEFSTRSRSECNYPLSKEHFQSGTPTEPSGVEEDDDLLKAQTKETSSVKVVKSKISRYTLTIPEDNLKKICWKENDLSGKFTLIIGTVPATAFSQGESVVVTDSCISFFRGNSEICHELRAGSVEKASISHSVVSLPCLIRPSKECASRRSEFETKEYFDAWEDYLKRKK